MKRNLLSTILALLVFVTGFSQTKLEQDAKNSKGKKENIVASNGNLTKKQVKALRKKHAKFLANSPYKKTMLMPKSERKANGLPPNKYMEQEWELTMDPAKGRPTTENLRSLRESLEKERADMLATGRTPGDASDNNWAERGPTNVGGRTRAIMFDPNDPTFNTVIAGGVSGGLWKNTNISSAASSWTRVNIPENLNVSCITYDPNNTNIFYVGTGESYVAGDVNGDGVWKSTNGGTSWSKVLGGVTGPTAFQSSSNVTINSPAGIAGNYAAIETTAFGTAIAAPITANIVLVIDDTAPSSDGCDGIINAAALSGKIALIRRGTCSFAIKVKAAQVAGAVAVIMMNNVANAGPAAMGGADATITIPSVAISKENGDILEAALGSGTVNGTLNPKTPGVPSGFIVPGIQHINDIVVKNNGGISEVFVAAADTYYAPSGSSTYLGSTSYGLYKSADAGSNWSQLSLPLTANGNKHCPNDIELSTDGTIWVSTKNSWNLGDGGGKIFSSINGGSTFVDKYTVTGNGGASRVEIEASATTANKLYVLSELEQANAQTPTVEVKLLVTTDGFATAPTVLNLPVGDEARETTYGFTGGQAFYDLMIESNPNDDQILYVGGIDLYRSANGGTSWTTISDWYSNVHSDQHAMAFKPGNPNIGIFGNDGGVYYSGSLSTTGTPATSRNTGFNVTQFYSLGVAPTGATGGNLVGEYFAAGAQDNGSQYFGGAGAGLNSSLESQGGDGAFTMFDQGADKYYITNYVYNCSINLRPIPNGTVRTLDNDANSDSNGQFICPMTLDSNLDLLFADYTTSATTPVYQIRRYSNIKSGVYGRTNLSNALLTTYPTALTVSKYTTASTKLLIGTRNGKLLKLLNANTVTATQSTAGTGWSDITGSGFVGSISDVEFGQNEDQIFVTMHNYGVTNIWYTANGTAASPTWVSKEGNLPDLPVKAILQNPLNTEEVIVGTELGVWYTNNFSAASPTWKRSYNGMSNVKVTDLDLRNDNTVFAATYGRGIFSGLFTAPSLLSANENSVVSNAIKVYPTINNGNVTISATQFFGQTKLNLFDITGKNVYSNTISLDNSEQKLNFGTLSSGNYILKLSGDSFEDTKRIIIE